MSDVIPVKQQVSPSGEFASCTQSNVRHLRQPGHSQSASLSLSSDCRGDDSNEFSHSLSLTLCVPPPGFYLNPYTSY